MRWCTRKLLCERLGISKWSSYQLFRANELPLVSVQKVVAVLNESRSGIEHEVFDIPQMLTPEELQERTGIPKEDLVRWSRRKRRPLPCFRLNKMTTRFTEKTAVEWLVNSTTGGRKRKR